MTVLVCYTVRVIPSYHSPRLIVQFSDCIVSFYCILIFQCVRTKHTWLKPEVYSWKPCNSHWAHSDSHKQPTGKGVQWKYHLKQTATRVCETVTVNIQHISPICSHNYLCHWNASCPIKFSLYRCKPVGNIQHPKTLTLTVVTCQSQLTDHHLSQNINCILNAWKDTSQENGWECKGQSQMWLTKLELL